jgi:predicted SprT family Zn-dependent metalloprotease
MTRKKRKALPSPSNYDLFDSLTVARHSGGTGLPTVDELYARFRLFNLQYFAGRLPTTKIRYSKRLLAAGLYVRDRNEIVISEKYHSLFPDDINDTLKHEMIHLIHFNHDKHFRSEAKRIGASYRAKSHPSLRLPPRYLYICPNCGTEYPRRKRLRQASCGICSPSKFDSRFKLVLKESYMQRRRQST